MRPLETGFCGANRGVMTEQTPIAQFPFLADVSAGGLALLERTTQHIACAAATPLVKRGDEVSSAYLVTKGALRVYYITTEGREGTLYWVEPGQSCILALNCMFSRLTYPAWVESEGETELSIVPGSTYRDLFSQEAAVQRFTFETLSSRLFELMAMVEETASQGLESRVAAFLLRRGKGQGELSITQEQIARHIGSSREVVSRVLRRLAALGLVETGPALIQVRDETGLKSLLS